MRNWNSFQIILTPVSNFGNIKKKIKLCDVSHGNVLKREDKIYVSNVKWVKINKIELLN